MVTTIVGLVSSFTNTIHVSIMRFSTFFFILVGYGYLMIPICVLNIIWVCIACKNLHTHLKLP